MIPFVTVAAAGAFLSAALFRFLADRSIEQAMYSMQLPENATGTLISPALMAAAGVASVIIFTGFALSAWYLFRRIAFPLHKVNTYLDALGSSTAPPPLRLRKDDEFAELAKELNLMASCVDERFSRIREQAISMEECLSQDTTEGFMECMQEKSAKLRTEIEETGKC